MTSGYVVKRVLQCCTSIAFDQWLMLLLPRVLPLLPATAVVVYKLHGAAVVVVAAVVDFCVPSVGTTTRRRQRRGVVVARKLPPPPPPPPPPLVAMVAVLMVAEMVVVPALYGSNHTRAVVVVMQFYRVDTVVWSFAMLDHTHRAPVLLKSIAIVVWKLLLFVVAETAVVALVVVVNVAPC